MESSKILAIFHFPIGHNVKISIFKKQILNFKISISDFFEDYYKEYLKNFGQKGTISVGEEKWFEIFTPIGSHVKENFNCV